MPTKMTLKLVPGDQTSQDFNGAVSELRDALAHHMRNRGITVPDAEITQDITTKETFIHISDPVSVADGGYSEVAIIDMVAHQGADVQRGLNISGQHVIRL
jgi:hypothetical protein